MAGCAVQSMVIRFAGEENTPKRCMHGADHLSADDENTPSWDFGSWGLAWDLGFLGGFVPRLLVWILIKWLRVSYGHYGLC
jgi:hypothetical protein